MDEAAETPKKGSKRLITLLFLLLTGGVIAAFFGYRTIKSKLADMASSSQDPKKIEMWLSEAGVSHFIPPPGFGVVRAYRVAVADKGMRAFVVGPEGADTSLPEDPQAAMDFGSYDHPMYFILTFQGLESNLDQEFQKVSEKIEQQGPTSVLQNRIWISGKEVPAMVAETAKEDRSYHSFAIRFSDRGFLWAVSPKEKTESAPHREVLASLFQVNPTDVSFKAPEPSGLELAGVIVSTDTAGRKKAVPTLAALQDPQPEAVTFLMGSLPNASTDVKIDIIAALGLLAKKNPEAISPLIVSLKDKAIRLEAMAALGSLGSMAGAAIPDLKKVAANKKEPKMIRKAASKTLAQIQGRPVPR